MSTINKTVHHCNDHMTKVKNVKSECEKCKEYKTVAKEQKVIIFLSITHITGAVEGQEESKGKNHDSPTRPLSALNKMYRKGGARNSKILLSHFFFALGEVDWNTLEADIRFSMYCPKT